MPVVFVSVLGLDSRSPFLR